MADETKKILLEIDLDVIRSAKSLNELKALQKSFNDELGKTEIGTQQYKKLEAQSILVTKEISKLKDSTKQLSSEIGTQKGSLRDLQSEYNKYSKALRETAPGNDVLGLSFEDAQKKALGLKTEIKDFEASLGNFQGNVGNYGTALKDASAQSGIFAKESQQVAQVQQQVSAGLNLAKVGFTSLKGAIISTGIGALILLLVSLVSYLKDTEQGGDALAKVLRVVGIVVQEITKLFVAIGEAIFEVGSKYFPILLEAVEEVINKGLYPFVKAIDLVGKGLEAIGLESAGESVQGFSKTVEGATTSVKKWVNGLIEVGSEIADLEDSLEDLQIKNQIVNSKLQTSVEQNLKALKNRTLSYQESSDLITKIAAAESEILKNNTKEIQQETDIQRKIFISQANDKAKAQDTFNKLLSGEIDAIEAISKLDGTNTAGTIKNIADVIVKQEDANRQFILLDTKLNNERDKLEEERKAKQAKAQDERFKSLQVEFDYEELLAQKRIALIDYQLKYSKLSIDERSRLTQEKNNELVNLEKKSLDIALQNIKLTQTERLILTEQTNQKIYAWSVQLEQDNKAINAQSLEDQKALDESLINLDISRTNRIIESNKKKIDNQKTSDEDRLALIDINLELELEKEEYRIAKLLESEDLLQADKIRIQEEAHAKQVQLTQDAEDQKQKALLKTKQINDSVEIAKLNIAKSTLGSIAALFDQQTAGYKALASAQALINTYQASTAALKSGSVISPVFGIISAGAAVLNGLASVAKINGVKFEQGGVWGGGSKQGIIGGNYHSNGGTKFYGTDGSMFEAERDELLTIVNRRDTKRLRGLSEANSFHGKPFFQDGGVHAPNYFADGGMVARSVSQPVFQQQESFDQMVRFAQSIPAPIVGVKEILTVADKRGQVRVDANLTRKQ